MPTPTVVWYVHGKEIKPSKDFMPTFEDGVARLAISQVYLDDEGEYTCVALNPVGQHMSTAYLSVKRKFQLKTTLNFS